MKKKYTLRVSYAIEVEADSNYAAVSRVNNLHAPLECRNLRIETVRIERIPETVESAPIVPTPIAAEPEMPF